MQFTCTGTAQALTVKVHAEDSAYRASVAFASATTTNSNGRLVDDREIEIVNP